MTKRKKRGPGKVAKFFGSILSKISWIALLGLGYYFYTIFLTFPMFPAEWVKWLIYGLIGAAVVQGFFAWMPFIPNWTKIFTNLINVALCAALAFGSWKLPNIRASIEKSFAEIPTEGEAEINFYILKDEYKVQPEVPVTEENNGEEQTVTQAAAPKLSFTADAPENTEEPEEGEETASDGPVQSEKPFTDFATSTFITQKTVDLENQEYALLVAERELFGNISTYGVDSIWDAVDRLYDGTGDVMVLNSSYLPMIEDVTGYEDFSSRVEIVYTVYKKIQLGVDPKEVQITQEPFTIFIAGVDQFGKVKSTTGRTDVNMLVTVNPQSKQISFVTVPRDAYVKNMGYYGMNDKLTHCGIYGIKATVESIEELFNVDVNYYFVVNFSSVIKLVDMIGGIDVNNPYEFKSTRLKTWKGTFKKGNIHLNGKKALVYVRERYNLKNGDFDRAKHQTLVIKAILDKMTTPAVVTQIDSIIDGMNGSFKTNLKAEHIYALAQMQLDDMAVWNMVNYSLSGTTGMDYCAAMGSKNKYSVVYLKDAQIKFVKNVMKAVRNGEVVEQEKLPS